MPAHASTVAFSTPPPPAGVFVGPSAVPPTPSHPTPATPPPPPSSSALSSPAVSSPATTQRLCVLALGVLVFHVWTSAVQERIFHLPGFSNILLLSLGETLCTTLLVGAQLTWKWTRAKQESSSVPCHLVPSGSPPHAHTLAASSAAGAVSVSAVKSLALDRVRVTLRYIFHPSTVELHWYVRIAVLMSCSLYLTNRTSYLLSYPLQVIFKSSKLLCMVLVRRWWMTVSEGRGEAKEEKAKTCVVAAATHPCRDEQRGGEEETAYDGPEKDDEDNERDDRTLQASSHTHTPLNSRSLTASPSAATAATCSDVFTPAARGGSHGARVPSPWPHNRTLSSATAAGGVTASIHTASAGVCEGSVRVPVPPAPHRGLGSRSASAADVGKTHRGGGWGGGTSGGVGRLWDSFAAQLRCLRGSWLSLLCRRLLLFVPSPPQPVRAVFSCASSLLCPRCVVSQHRPSSAERCVDSVVPWRVSLRRRAAQLRERVCTRHGWTQSRRAAQAFVRWLVDGELLACTVMVLGLILFTYASHSDVRPHAVAPQPPGSVSYRVDGQLGTAVVAMDTTTTTTTARVAAPPTQTALAVTVANGQVPLGVVEHLDPLPHHQQQQQQQQIEGGRNADHLNTVPTPLVAAAAASDTPSRWTRLSRLYTLWFVTMVGVTGVLLSNLIDAVIYMLEEVYCFQTAKAPSASDTSTRAGCYKAKTMASMTPQMQAERNGEACVRDRDGDERVRRNVDVVELEVREAAAEGRGTTAADVACTQGDTSWASHNVPSYSTRGAFINKDPSGAADAHWTQRAAGTRTPSPLPISQASHPQHQQHQQQQEKKNNAYNSIEAMAREYVEREPATAASIPATSQEVLFMLNSIATLLYCGGLLLPWLGSSLRSAFGAVTQRDDTVPSPPPSSLTPGAETPLSLVDFTLMVILASVTSLMGTLCLLAIVAEYTGVVAVMVTIVRKTCTILLSFMIYGRRFTVVHALGLTGVMGGVVWSELLRRRRQQQQHGS